MEKENIITAIDEFFKTHYAMTVSDYKEIVESHTIKEEIAHE